MKSYQIIDYSPCPSVLSVNFKEGGYYFLRMIHTWKLYCLVFYLSIEKFTDVPIVFTVLQVSFC